MAIVGASIIDLLLSIDHIVFEMVKKNEKDEQRLD